MRLKLVLRGPERMMGAQLEKTLDNGSLVIGRSPAAGWVLPDPERIVSKSHCRIDRDFSGFILTDTSTNGVEINGVPVGFGTPRLLSNGDVLKLGDVVVLVRVEAPAEPVVPAAPVVAPLPMKAVQIPDDGPFGIAETDLPPEMFAVDSAPQPASQAPSGAILDDWWQPEIASAPTPPAIPVDIFSESPIDAIPHTTLPQDSLPLVSGNVVSLVETCAHIDVLALARAVDSATRALPEIERRGFYERLRDLLEGN